MNTKGDGEDDDEDEEDNKRDRVIDHAHTRAVANTPTPERRHIRRSDQNTHKSPLAPPARLPLLPSLHSVASRYITTSPSKIRGTKEEEGRLAMIIVRELAN